MEAIQLLVDGAAAVIDTVGRLRDVDVSVVVDAIAVYDHVLGEEAESQQPLQERLTRLRALVNALHLAEWFPSQVLAEHLDPRMIEQCIAQPLYIHRVQDRFRTQAYFTVPLFSIAFEDVEGYMNIFLAVQQTLDTTGESNEDAQSAAIVLWKKIENILVTHNIAYFRIIELLLQAFAAKVAAYHRLFLAVFQLCPWHTVQLDIGSANVSSAQTDNIGHILGFTFAEPTLVRFGHPVRSSAPVLSQRDPHIEKLDRTLQKNGLVSAFLAKLVTSDVSAEKDWHRVEGFIERLMSDSSATQLFLVAALLIKHKIIHLESVWNQLYPRDIVDLETVYLAQYTKRLSHLSSLRRYLQSDTPAAPTMELLQSDKYAEWPVDFSILLPECQKAALLQAMLAVGDLPNALLLLDAYPLLARLFPGVAEQLARVTEAAMGTLTQRLYPNAVRERCSITYRPLPTTSTTPYRDRQTFFYAEWTDQISLITEFDEIHSYIIPRLLTPLKPTISDHPLLVFRLCRIGKLHLQTDNSERTRHAWLTFVCEYAFPCLCIAQPAQQLNDAIWDLLRDMPYQKRFVVYQKWRLSDQPDLEIRAAFEVIDNATRWIMKQVSSATLKISQRKLARLSLNNPIVVFGRVLELIQNYDHDMIDLFRYCTSLGYDVLVFMLYQSLCNPLRSRMKDDLINTADWLTKTATFAGKFYKRYPETDFQPMLDYTRRFARRGSYCDTAVLSATIEYCAGIKVIQDISDDMIYAMESGKTLRLDTVISYDLHSRTSVDWLIKHLKRDGFLRETLLLLCQSLSRLKSIPNFDMMTYDEVVQGSRFRAQLEWFDKIQAVLCQSVNFIRLFFTTSEIQDAVPDMTLLCGSADIDAGLAFMLIRLKHQCDLPGREAFDAFIHDPQAPAMSSLIQQAPGAISIVSSSLTLYMYTLFWTSSTYDLRCIEKLYIERKAQKGAVLKNRESNSRDIAGMRSVMKQMDTIERDKKEHLEHAEQYKSVLVKNGGLLFQETAQIKGICNDLLQHCIYRRMTVNPVEATFCANFIIYLHRLNIPRFSTLFCLDQIFSHAYIMYGLTMDECKSYGRMLKILLDQLQQWHADVRVYTSDALGDFRLAGLAYLGDLQPNEEGIYLESDLLSYRDFRNTLAKWHTSLTNAITFGLFSNNPTLIRSASVVLCSIAGVFPLIEKHRDIIMRACKRWETVDEFKLPIMAALGGLHRKNYMTDAKFGHVKDLAKQIFYENAAERLQQQVQPPPLDNSTFDRSDVVTLSSRKRTPSIALDVDQVNDDKDVKRHKASET